MRLNELLSDSVGPVGKEILHFKREYSSLWLQAETDFPGFGKTYSKQEQRESEVKISEFLDEIGDNFESVPREKNRRLEWVDRSMQAWHARVQDLLQFLPVAIDPDFEKGFVRTTRDFVENLKVFDPYLKIENLYQALRNVWIMNSLQIYMNLPIEHSDAIFAYSLIYPYTDNYLDDASLSMGDKLRMMRDLRARLEGQTSAIDDEGRNKVQHLVRKIESQYGRDRYPGVYQSLLAIYNGQIRSLIQQSRQGHSSEAQILDISLDKGGASVLADGYLIRGFLNRDEADFCFGFGLFLQLADDVQDIEEDRKNNHMTLFSRNSADLKLDDLANKLFFVVKTVLDRKFQVSSEKRKKLKKLIHDSCFFLIMEAVGRNRSSFSSDYVAMIERSFPVRFDFLKTMQRKVKNRFLKKNRTAIDLDFVSAVLLSVSSRTFL